MDEIKNQIKKILEQHPARIIVSRPKTKSSEPNKIVVIRRGECFQEEKIINNQAFHENFDESALAVYIERLLDDKFLRLNAFNETHEFSIAISKKGKASYSQTKSAAMVNASETHNREKHYILKEDTIIEPLIDMGIFTGEGKVVRSMYDKYRQINRFIEVIDDIVSKFSLEELTVIDFGCGKGYLTFLVYYYLVKIRNIKARIVGLDLKEDVVKGCNAAASKYGYEGLSFKCIDIKNYTPDFPVDMVISLHACDTATDYALFKSIRWKAKMIFAIPCCQHEVNSQISSDEFACITRYGVIKEQISSAFTDAIRGNMLTYCGYKVQLIDIVSPVYTPKNILIRAVKTNIPEDVRNKAMDEVTALTGEFNLNPTLLKLIRESTGNL